VTMIYDPFDSCKCLNCIIFKGVKNVEQNVQLPSTTNVFVPKTFRGKYFGGRPVIKLDLDNTSSDSMTWSRALLISY